jgi:hypothetical protein
MWQLTQWLRGNPVNQPQWEWPSYQEGSKQGKNGLALLKNTLGK